MLITRWSQNGSAGFKERPSWVEGEIISGILDIK